MENWENEYPEVDDAGRRFRRVGNVIEYEPYLNGQPRHVFAMSRDRQKSQEDERYRREQADALEGILSYSKFKKAVSYWHKSGMLLVPRYSGTAPRRTTKHSL